MDVLGFKVNMMDTQKSSYTSTFGNINTYTIYVAGPDGDFHDPVYAGEEPETNDVVLRKYDSVSICADHGKQ